MNNDLISRDYVEKIIISEFVDLQDGTEEWRTYVNDTCENILNKVHSAPTVDFIISPDYVTELQNINKELIKQLEEAERPQGECKCVTCKYRSCEITEKPCRECSRSWTDLYEEANMKGGAEE